jgi:hypothetical protein
MASSAAAQQKSGVPGSPDATITIDGKYRAWCRPRCTQHRAHHD